jgi:hypothetical protein
MMKKLTMVILILLLSAGLACTKGKEIQQKAGDLTVAVKMEKNPPVQGDNGISVTVKDPDGKEVTDAAVTVEYSMPPMPGMPPMNYSAALDLKENRYQGKLNFSMSGPWDIMVKIVRGPKTVSTNFTVDVQ